MKNLKTFETYTSGDDNFWTEFEREMKDSEPKGVKIKMGDTVCIGKINKASGSRTFDLFDGKYYRCIGQAPVVLEEEKTSEKRTLTDEECNKATQNPNRTHLWTIEE